MCVIAGPKRLVHLLFAALVVLIIFPGRRETASPLWFLLCVVVIEGAAICLTRHGKHRASCDIASILLLLFIIWELCSTVLDLAHQILIPTPEAVFAVFPAQWRLMLRGVVSSLSLLAIGFVIALPLGTLMGALTGWVPRLREVAVPIARVMAPIPAIIYAPYLVALMPSFRAASALVLVLGIFWPTFLQTVNRVVGIDKVLLDSARSMALSDSEMIFQVFLPWLIPGVLSSLRVSLSTSFMLLTLACLLYTSPSPRDRG